jgi:hypothetical protein
MYMPIRVWRGNKLSLFQKVFNFLLWQIELIIHITLLNRDDLGVEKGLKNNFLLKTSTAKENLQMLSKHECYKNLKINC